MCQSFRHPGWEFPGVQGIGCNTVNPNDTSNFLIFLQQLRNSSIGHGLILSAAASIKPWVDSSGFYSKHLSGFSKVLNLITIMDYDLVSNPTIGVGPSWPLNDSCAPMSTWFGSAVHASTNHTKFKPYSLAVSLQPEFAHLHSLWEPSFVRCQGWLH